MLDFADVPLVADGPVASLVVADVPLIALLFFADVPLVAWFRFFFFFSRRRFLHYKKNNADIQRTPNSYVVTRPDHGCGEYKIVTAE